MNLDDGCLILTIHKEQPEKDEVKSQSSKNKPQNVHLGQY